MTVELTYRPLSAWPGHRTDSSERRSRYTFRASRDDTMKRVKYEVGHLGADRAVIELGMSDRDIRKDGTPRADARMPLTDPGVILSFDSRHGPLRYATDLYESWEHNLRAIALGLEALRAVDRYGITSRAEQYRGFAQLPAGITTNEPMSALEAAKVLIDLADEDGLLGYEPSDLGRKGVLDELWTIAVRIHHPDTGGNADLYRRANEARTVLQGANA